MLRSDKISVTIVTVYLIIYLALLQFEATQAYGVLMLLAAPALLCWMVYTILKYGSYTGPELGDKEFGYQDRSNDQLGTL